MNIVCLREVSISLGVIRIDNLFSIVNVKIRKQIKNYKCISLPSYFFRIHTLVNEHCPVYSPIGTLKQVTLNPLIKVNM